MSLKLSAHQDTTNTALVPFFPRHTILLSQIGALEEHCLATRTHDHHPSALPTSPGDGDIILYLKRAQHSREGTSSSTLTHTRIYHEIEIHRHRKSDAGWGWVGGVGYMHFIQSKEWGGAEERTKYRPGKSCGKERAAEKLFYPANLNPGIQSLTWHDTALAIYTYHPHRD